MNIKIPISPGELADKISILEIKTERIKDLQKLQNIYYEHNLLHRIWLELSFDKKSIIKMELLKLKKINKKLWEIEDQIRVKEAKKEFDGEFITLARLVYISNDKRSVIKRRINQVFGSNLIEEKSYSAY